MAQRPKAPYSLSPRQLPSGRWKGRVVHYDSEGRRHEETRSFDSKRAAKQWAEQEAVRGREDPSRGGAGGEESLAAYLERWLAIKGTLNLAQKTLTSYREMAAHSIQGLGAVALADLTPFAIQRLYADLNDTSHLSPRTIRYVHTVLHMALKDAMDWGVIASNPAARVKVATPRGGPSGLRIPSPDEMAQLLEANRNTRWYPLWAWLASTGSRLGEALALQWEDIDWTRGTATIQRAVSGDAGQRVIKTPKTASGGRTVALGPGMLAALREQQAIQDGVRGLAGTSWREQGWVFSTGEGNVLSKRYVDRAFKSALARAGLPQAIRVHDLRHGMATHWLAQGKNPKVVSQRLGHATAAFTLQVYGHVLPSHEAHIAEEMEGEILPDSTPKGADGPQTGRRNPPESANLTRSSHEP